MSAVSAIVMRLMVSASVKRTFCLVNGLSWLLVVAWLPLHEFWFISVTYYHDVHTRNGENCQWRRRGALIYTEWCNGSDRRHCTALHGWYTVCVTYRHRYSAPVHSWTRSTAGYSLLALARRLFHGRYWTHKCYTTVEFGISFRTALTG